MLSRARATAWRYLLLLIVGSGVSGVTAATTAADAPPLILEHLTTADGLPQGTVYTVLQDSQGFVWLGTEDGLIRYDGHEVLRYAYSRMATNSLPGNFVYQVAEDARRDLWIALKDAGLARWNRASDSFTVFRHEARNPSSLSSDAARTVLVDRDGRIWLGTSDAGLNIVDPASGRITKLYHNPADPGSLTDDRVAVLTLDRSGRIWVGTAGGLDRWDATHGVFVHYRHDPTDRSSLSGEQVSEVREDHAGAIWVGTFDGGLDRMDSQGHVTRVFRHRPDDPTSLASDEVRAVLEDQAGHLWVATSDGLDLVDPYSGQASHYRADSRDPDALRDSDVLSLYEDRSGLVWIGTRSAGVSRWNPRSWEFGSRRPEWLSGKPVTSFASAGGDKVWIGSLGGGLTQFDLDTGKAIPIDTLLGRANAVGDTRVMSLLRDRRGDLWIGTFANGLLNLTAAGKLTAIPVRPGDSLGISAAGIMTLFEASNGLIWIGTYGGGANILDPATRRVRHLPYQPDAPASIGFPNVSAFAEDSQGNVWIGTDGGGLGLARPDGTLVKVFRQDPHDPRTLPANTVFALAVDSKDRVWVATDGGGLARVVGSPSAPESIQFEAITREQGLTSDTLYGVVPDASGHLWLSGYAGLVRYDPDEGVVKTYHRQHGLQGEEFDFNAYHRLPDGRLCFGGPGGFNIFAPNHISENHVAPRLALTRVSVMGVPFATDKPSWLLERLNLGYRANIVSLDFGVLDFTSPKLNRIAYRMSGLTDHWIELGAQRRVTLTNLEAGDHVLEVRAAGADAVWSEQPLRLLLHRDPAPWRSAWAYAAYLLILLALIAYRIHSQREKFRAVLREQRRLEESARALTERIVQVRTLVDALPDRLWVVDGDGRVQWSPQDESSDSRADVLAPPQSLPEVLHAIRQTALDGRQRKLEYRQAAPEGGNHSYEMRFTRRESGDVVVTRQDTSERTAAAEHIERLAYVDTLTGLPNRQRCLDTAHSLFADAGLSGEKVAVLYLDLNNFKRVNDTLGHSIGDEVLRTASRRLEQASEPIRLTLPHVSIARFGGDEFVALLRIPRADDTAMRVAQTFCAAFEAPISQKGLDFYCAPSIGIATYPDDGTDVTTVFKHADTAMYHAKTGSSGAIAIYTPAMSSRLRDWLDLESRLRHAVQDGILQLYFQPKFSLSDNRLVGVEALLRWRDAEHGDIPPTRFIEIAEDSGLIIDIGAWVTRAACGYLRRWLDAGHSLPIAINVSAKELLYGDPAGVIEAETAAADIPPGLIEVEITESLLVKDSSPVQSALQRLRQLGCRIALDDFGTGYSSLAYITRFPPDRIKIDKAFVRNVDQSASDAAIASTILSLGASLDLTVTAEGVERTGQLEWLRSRGCHEAQGFLLSRALPAAEFERRFLFDADTSSVAASRAATP